MTKDDEQAVRSRAAEQFISALPHCRALSMRVEEVGEGVAVISMPWSEDIVGDPRTGVIHGGAVSALMDTSGGAAVLCHPGATASTATMDLRIDYMRAAKPHQRIRARAVCHHVTRSVAFVRAEAFDEDGDGPVATANGAFTVDRG
ncbi:MAG: PaaI family thioesterase [Pseudomonadota bacterium]